MSEVPPRLVTAPLAAAAPAALTLPLEGADMAGAAPAVLTLPMSVAQQAAAPARGHATQLSALAIPPTVDSTSDALAPPEVDTAVDQRPPELPPSLIDDDRTARDDAPHNAALPDDAHRDDAHRDDAHRDDALRDLSPAHVADPAVGVAPRHGGTPTLLSNFADGASASPAPARDVEVVQLAAPPAALPPPAGHGGGPPSGQQSSTQSMPPPYAPAGAGWGLPPAHALPPFGGGDGRHVGLGGHASLARAHQGGAAEPRRSNGPMIALIVAGGVVVVGALAAAGGLAIVLARRQAPSPTAATPAVSATGGSVDSAVPASPGAAPPSAIAAAAPPMGTVPRAQPRGPDVADPKRGISRAGGTKARLTSVVAASLDLGGVRAGVIGSMPRIDACFAATELEPPNHESAFYDLDVSAAGAVTRASPATTAGRCAKLDVCVTGALRSARMPASPRGGPVRVGFSAPIVPR